MSGTYPTDPAPRDVSLRSVQPTLVSTAHSLQQQVRSRGAQRWAIRLDYPALTRPQWAPLFAFAMAQRGQYETFTLALPVLTTPQGTWAGSPAVKGAGQTGRSVAVDGFTAGATVKAGDLCQFAGDAKVYMVTADATADGAGEATLAIEPALQATPADDAAVASSTAVFTVAFASDVREATMVPGKILALTVDLVERV